MYQFVETLCAIDGSVRNLRYHEARLNATRQHFFGACVPLSLAPVLSSLQLENDKMKIRILYEEKGITEIIASPYTMRAISSLQIVTCDAIDYTYKSTDRSALNILYAQRGRCDEILIVKRGALTDTSYTNIALYDGKQWYTPAQPLLKGTMREMLLHSRRIEERNIQLEDLYRYQQIMLLNAMIGFGELILPTENIMKE